jgi:hypothetical protein
MQEGNVMGHMPDWFAKTKEMMASDLYFSLVDAGSESGLIDRYHQALNRLNITPDDEAPQDSDALQRVWRNKPGRVRVSMDSHFVGDWIYHRYYEDTALYANRGGAYWPLVPSRCVVDRIREGTKIAIHKALGQTELASRSELTPGYRQKIFKQERYNDVDIDGVRPLATSWNCVAPAGTDFFEVAALRGPTIVELAIGTPRPYDRSPLMDIIQKVLDGGYDAFEEEEEEEEEEEPGSSS